MERHQHQHKAKEFQETWRGFKKQMQNKPHDKAFHGQPAPESCDKLRTGLVLVHAQRIAEVGHVRRVLLPFLPLGVRIAAFHCIHHEHQGFVHRVCITSIIQEMVAYAQVDLAGQLSSSLSRRALSKSGKKENLVTPKEHIAMIQSRRLSSIFQFSDDARQLCWILHTWEALHVFWHRLALHDHNVVQLQGKLEPTTLRIAGHLVGFLGGAESNENYAVKTSELQASVGAVTPFPRAKRKPRMTQ